ncbi:MAG: mobile mystery protein B [Bacteroidota bacterium]
MGLTLHHQPGQTPIEADQLSGIRIKSVSTQGQLNEFEQANINDALLWLRTASVRTVLSIDFVRTVHRQMFGQVWSWAGSFRQHETNIGVDWHQIPVELKVLIDDAAYWIHHETFAPDEIAIRFKHRLVAIHCFSNGNGRHSRLMADLIAVRNFGMPEFTWGRSSYANADSSRTDYLDALRLADSGDVRPLVTFARS